MPARAAICAMGHIEAGTIHISAILPEDKMQELAQVFKGYKEESLTPLKEIVGSKFTWDELKWFKAILEINRLQNNLKN